MQLMIEVEYTACPFNNYFLSEARQAAWELVMQHSAEVRSLYTVGAAATDIAIAHAIDET